MVECAIGFHSPLIHIPSLELGRSFAFLVQLFCNYASRKGSCLTSSRQEVWQVDLAVFCAIPPLQLLGEATDQLSIELGQTLGALLNASFGNAVEIIVGIAALLQGQNFWLKWPETRADQGTGQLRIVQVRFRP